MTQLVKAEVARKEQIKDGSRKVMAYALNTSVEDADADATEDAE